MFVLIYEPIRQVASPEHKITMSDKRYSYKPVISLVFNVWCEITGPNFAVRWRDMDRCIQHLRIIAQADRTAAMLAATVHNAVV
jgi:hypothetical protein